MGLDCVVKYHNGEEFTSELSIELAEKLKSIIPYGIIGYDIKKYDNYFYVSFRGKAYQFVILKLTNISLYNDLEYEELKNIYEKLNDFVENHESLCIEQIQKAYEDTWSLPNWIELLVDEYVPSPNELIGLGKLFKICYENKLQLYASY
jgi:hypothetical protein